MATSNTKTYNVVIPLTTGGNPDLTAQDGAEGVVPERLDVVNNESTAQDIALEDFGGTTRVFSVPADSVRKFENVKFVGIVSASTGTIAEVTAYYAVA